MRPPDEPNPALGQLLAAEMERGVDVFGDGRREPPAPGPPLVLPPLQRPVFPEPDWRAELAAAERRDAADASRYRDAAEPDPEPPPDRTPPDRRRPRTTTTGRAWRDHR